MIFYAVVMMSITIRIVLKSVGRVITMAVQECANRCVINRWNAISSYCSVMYNHNFFYSVGCIIATGVKWLNIFIESILSLYYLCGSILRFL